MLQLVENTSTFNRADIRFFIWQNNKNAAQYLRRLAALLYGVFLLGFAIWLVLKNSSFAYWTNSLLTIFGFTMGPYFIIQAVFHKQLMLRKAAKSKDLQTPRCYQIGADNITVQTIVSGAEVTNRFLSSSLEGFWETTDTVYIRLKLDKKTIYYLCFHDDGYTQGNRDELLNWLRQHNVIEKTVKKQ